MSDSLFKPIKVGRLDLSTRIVLAPLTRVRANTDGSPNDLNAEYYAQRASNPGTLLIAEATRPSKRGGGLMPTAPAIETEENIAGWSKVTKAVHDKGSHIFLQIWMLGKEGSPELAKAFGVKVGSSSKSTAINFAQQKVEAEEYTTEEVTQLVQDYIQGAKNAIEAGFDGVEIHAAHGYLINQFLDPVNNKRTDQYGGSIENRARFLLEIVDGISGAIGADRTSVRLSPWLNSFNTSYGPISPIPQFSYVVSELEARARAGRQLAYLHVVEPRIAVAITLENFTGSNEFIRLIWSGTLIRAGGFTREAAIQTANKDDKTLIAFGRYFISNPDIIKRLEKDIPLTHYIRDKFYTSGPEGYTDYPTAT